eukprot:TRINITY_DN3940_c0_g1_i10.p4 TRINITY_DN3940_c0_g1~~TRINITY_DN3940_c0_g1_i10.p4  ORF type:complete len:288 (-),score=51.86 TRINITY_DN3940_c0_g1_i10:345-1208(-)
MAHSTWFQDDFLNPDLPDLNWDITCFTDWDQPKNKPPPLKCSEDANYASENNDCNLEQGCEERPAKKLKEDKDDQSQGKVRVGKGEDVGKSQTVKAVKERERRDWMRDSFTELKMEIGLDEGMKHNRQQVLESSLTYIRNLKNQMKEKELSLQLLQDKVKQLEGQLRVLGPGASQVPCMLQPPPGVVVPSWQLWWPQFGQQMNQIQFPPTNTTQGSQPQEEVVLSQNQSSKANEGIQIQSTQPQSVELLVQKKHCMQGGFEFQGEAPFTRLLQEQAAQQLHGDPPAA